jgi:hypothetical protein
MLELKLPHIHDLMTSAKVVAVHAQPGAALRPGARLLDVAVDLTPVAAHDCPPVSLYRIVLREVAWLRRLDVACGDEVAPGDSLAMLSSAPDDPLDVAPSRQARIAIAGILADAESFAPDAP